MTQTLFLTEAKLRQVPSMDGTRLSLCGKLIWWVAVQSGMEGGQWSYQQG
jgi:hypothetical protein